MFRPHWVCPAQGCLCFPRLPCSGSWLLYMERALRWVRFQFSGPPQKRGFGCACVLCLPRPERFRQPEAWRPLPGCGAPFPSAASGPGSQRLWRPLPGCGAPFPSKVSSLGSQRLLGALAPGAARLFPPRPQRAPPVGSQEIFRYEPGPVCSAGGSGFFGLSLPLSPPPCLLPPAGMGRLFSGVSQSPRFANHRRRVLGG